MRVEAGLFWVPFEETQRPEWVWSYVPERLVPLTHVHAEAVLVETTSEVKIIQKYYNYQSKLWLLFFGKEKKNAQFPELDVDSELQLVD